MRKIFTKLTTCPEHVEGQIFSVNTASFVCGTPTTINDIKNNYKDDLANAGSFSFIETACYPELVEGLSTDNFFNRQLSTSNPPTPNKSFMSTLLRKSKFVSLLIAGLFLISNNIIAQSCASNNIGFNSDTTKNALAICIGTTGTTINGSAPGGGATYQYQVSTTSPGTTGYSNAAGTSTTQELYNKFYIL